MIQYSPTHGLKVGCWISQFRLTTSLCKRPQLVYFQPVILSIRLVVAGELAGSVTSVYDLHRHIYAAKLKWKLCCSI